MTLDDILLRVSKNMTVTKHIRNGVVEVYPTINPRDWECLLEFIRDTRGFAEFYRDSDDSGLRATKFLEFYFGEREPKTLFNLLGDEDSN